MTLSSARAGCARAPKTAFRALRRLASRTRVADARLDQAFVGAIDMPASGLVVAPKLVRVVGWTLPAGDASVARIHVRVGGRAAGLARLFSQERPDVADFSPVPSAPLAGFECWTRVTGTPGQRVRIEVDVEDLDGAFTSLEPREITIGVEDHAGERADAGQPLRREPTSSSNLARRAGSRADVRLVVFTHRLGAGGAQLYLQELLERLLADTETSCLVISEVDGPLRARLEDLGAEVLIGDFPVDTVDAYEVAVGRFAMAVERHGADVVLVNTLLAGIGADVARRLGVPAIWMIRDTVTLDEFWLAAYGDDGIAPEVRAALTGTLARVPAIVFETYATQAALADACAPEHGVVVAHGGRLDLIDEFRAAVTHDEARRRIGVADDRFVVLSVGGIEPHKGQAALVFAFAQIAGEYPHASLVLLGDSDNPYGQAVRQSVDRLGLGDRIRIEGAVTDPYPWYRAADAFVLASDMDTMPRTLLEAMAFELPCVATAVGGIPELVVHRRNGLAFPPRDLSALVDVLRDLLDLSVEERAALGVAASRDVRARHQSSTEIDTFRTLISTLSARGGSRASG